MSFLASLFQAPSDTTGANSSNSAVNWQQYGPQIAQALSAFGGSNGQGGINGQQTSLAQMLQSFINNPTQGPNLAAQQLLNATQANNQAAAGAVSSTQGINPALASRQILDTSNANNMAAAGQAAEARLQQQIADQAQLEGVLGQQAGENLQSENQALGANTAQNAANVSNVTSSQALTNQQQQQNLSNSVNLINGIGSAIGLGTGLAGKPSLPGAGASTAAPTGAYPGSTPTAGSSFGIPNLVGAFAKGGVVQDYFMNHPELRKKAIMMNVAGKKAVPIKVSPGEKLLNEGGEVTVPGKAKVAGDSPKNDTKNAVVAEGTVVIPRSIASNPKLEEEFLESLHEHQRKRFSPAIVKEILQASRA